MATTNIFHRFRRLFMDGIKQDQPGDTVSDAIGWQVIKGSDGSLYYTSEYGNIYCIGLPEGYNLRGRVYLEEQDQWVFMGLVDGKGEIGIADRKTKTYTTLITDDELDIPLGLKDCVWTKMLVNVHAQCTRIKIYFSTNYVYRVIELFDPCKDYSNTLLMKPTSVKTLQITKVRGIGNLANGAYRAALRIMDDDNNDTNFGTISEPMYIADGDYLQGEQTNYGLVIEAWGLPPEYNLGELVILETFDGGDKYKVIKDVAFGGGYFHYQYTGAEGFYSEVKLADISNKYQRYFNGPDLSSHDGSLFLFNVNIRRNFNLQKYVNKFKVGYRRYLVPMRDAENYKGLRSNENVDYAIWYKGKDGTRTIAFNFINHVDEPEGTILPGDPRNCQSCEIPSWAAQDTSKRTKLYIEDITKIDLENEDFSQTNTEFYAEVNPKHPIDTPNNNLSFTCSGTCSLAQDVNIGTCGGSICGTNIEGTKVLPRSSEEVEPVEPVFNTYIEDKVTDTQFIRDIFQGIWIALQENILCICNTMRTHWGLPIVEKDFSYNDPLADYVALLKTDFVELIEKVSIFKAKSQTSYDKMNYIDSGWPCTSPGERRCDEQICYECINGTWQYKNNSIYYNNRSTPYERKPKFVEAVENRGSGSGNKGGGTNPLGITPNPFGQGCIPNLAEPILYSEGLFGYAETNQRYPETIGRDDCEPIFREYAGKNVRLYKVPSLSKEPIFISLQNGVPTINDIGNDENNKTYAIFTVPWFYDVTVPPELADWVDPDEPFEIGYSYRDEANKTVISTGLLHSCFGGDIQNEQFLFPKLAANSFEFYDKAIHPGGNNTLRRGYATTIPAYIYHSPDYHIWGNKTVPHYLLFENEMYGKGYRHGDYAESDKPDTWSAPKINNAGTREGINLNKCIPHDGPIVRCIQGFTEAKANSIVGKDDLMFTRSLINLYREGSQYLELTSIDGNCVCPPCPILQVSLTGGVSAQGGSVTFHLIVPGDIVVEIVGKTLTGKNAVHTEIPFASTSNVYGFAFSATITSENGCTYTYGKTIVVTNPVDPAPGVKSDYNYVDPISAPNQTIDCECPDKAGRVPFSKTADGEFGSLNGGDLDSDNSFIGHTIDQTAILFNNRCHQVTAMRYLPNQYGSIISRPFITFGTWKDFRNLKITLKDGKYEFDIFNGDSFIGQFNYKRTAFVSDKTNEDISPNADFGALFTPDQDANWITRLLIDLFSGILRAIFRNIGYENIGTVPRNGDATDPRNLFGGLRGNMRAQTLPTDPIGPPSSGETPDAFNPHMLKVYINTYMPSDANINYRGTRNVLLGDDGIAEVYRSKLKTLHLDSTMPEGFNWTRAWLNRTYAKMKEPSRWKFLLRMAILFAAIYVIGFYFLLKGVDWFQKAFAVAGGGIDVAGVAVSFWAGLIIKLALGTFFIFLGISWINFWAGNELLKKIVDAIVGIEWAHPDKTLRGPGEAGQGSRWAMHTDKVVQVEDNYWYYNPDFSKTNNSEYVFGIPYFYDTEWCPWKSTNRIIATNKQDPTSPLDAWRQFKANHYADIPRDRGALTDLVSIGSRLIAHTTDTMFQINYQGDRATNYTNEELLIGRSYQFGKSVDIYAGVLEGWGGSKDPNATSVTKNGYFYFDRDARRFNYLAGGNQELSFTGIEEFMDDNLKFHLLDHFPDFNIIDQKCKNGIHFDFAIDHGNDMIYIHKQDFEPIPGKEITFEKGSFKCKGKKCDLHNPKYFKNKSFLFSYSIRRGAWISRHYWRPEVWLWDRYSIYTKMGDKILSHDTKNVFGNFNDVQYPYYIEIPMNKVSELHNTFILRNIKVVGELIEVYEDGTEKELDEPLFDKYQIYNGRQNSGWLTLRDQAYTEDEDLIRDMTEEAEMKWAFKGNGSVIQEFKNELTDGSKVFNTFDVELDIFDIDGSPKNNNGVFEDDFVVLRLLSYKKKNQKIHLRKVLVSIDTEEDG